MTAALAEFVRWTPDLETGIPAVDRQHRGLVERLNQIAPLLALNDPGQRQVVDTTLDALVLYAAEHFQTEEALMDRYGVMEESASHHRKTHADFVYKVTSMVQANRQGKGPTGSELLSFLAGWLVYHILGEDQALARQLHAIKGKGLSPAYAFHQAIGGRLVPKSSAMVRSLVDSYQMLSERIAELAHTNEDLEDKVRGRTAELELARGAAEAGSLAKARFIRAISHELRTPMNAIQSHALILEQSGLSGMAEESAREILQASQLLLDRINSLIEFSQQDPEMTVEPTRIFCMQHLLKNTLTVPFRQAKAKGLQAKLVLDAELSQAYLGSVETLKNMLHPILDNAVRFTKKGQILIRIAPTKQGLSFRIKDSGPGIDENYQNRLFEAFTQGDERLSRHHGGMGMGLALAARLAGQVGAELWLESSSSQGSCFVLDVPLSAAERADCPPVAWSDDSWVGRSEAQATPESGPGRGKGRFPDDQERGQLEQLLALLEVNDTAAATLCHEIDQPLIDILGPEWMPFQAHMDGFDYQSAANVVRACLNRTGEI